MRWSSWFLAHDTVSPWVRGVGELLPAPALVAERSSFPRGSAVTRWLGRCYEAIPGFAQAHGMGSFSDQHHGLNVTLGVPRFRDTGNTLVCAAQWAAGVHGQDLSPTGRAYGTALAAQLDRKGGLGVCEGVVRRGKTGAFQGDVAIFFFHRPLLRP